MTCRTDLRKCEVIFDEPKHRAELKELEARAASPDFWNDQNKAQATIAKTKPLRNLLEPLDRMSVLLDDAWALYEIAELEEEETERKAAAEEIRAHVDRIEKELNRAEFHALLSGKFDSHNAYLTLHAGAGGTESCDWADMLLRMYRRYADRQGFHVDILHVQAGDEAGIKSASIMVSGPYAYGHLKGERGVHRLVRISPFDSNKRRHTSFAALDVVAEIDEAVDVQIDEKDLRVDTFRSSGAGGQHVNTTDSAVRITHQPTGIVVACQAERSQHKNRSKAMKLLLAKLYEWEEDQKRQEMEKFYGDKGDIAWGRQIRSYVMQPYTLVKDHRTDVQVGNVEAILDGDLEPFIEAYLKKGPGHE